MIALTSISKHYSGDYLFRDLTLQIGDRERVAIVGPNGAGKTTLMKIIVGLIEPDTGNVVQSRSNTVGYLPQDGVQHTEKTLYDQAAEAFEDILALHDRIDVLGSELRALHNSGMTDPEREQSILDEMGEVQHQLEHREGYNIDSSIGSVLSGLGFRTEEFNRHSDEFSGGWQMRIALAKLLLREPTILLLDEPTNHLDMDSLEWLESFLQAYEGSVVMVSHDTRFLDSLVKRTVEISAGKVVDYSGNYSYYLEQRALRKRQLESAYENQQQLIKQTTQFVERFRYKATKARQVQSRIKMLDRLERIEPEGEDSGISFDFPPPPQPGRILIELENVTKSYDKKAVFQNCSLAIDRGDRIAMLGVNGSGKSTLAKIVAGIEPFDSGARMPGHNLTISYFAQNQAEALNPKRTVFETVEESAVGEVRKQLRSLLGCFLFSGDDVNKYVAVLSGGEKSRLALAKMLLTPANLLIMDEPTNHLDVRSKAVLQDALSRFEGSYLIVSHDRDFLEPLINKVWDFEDGKFRQTLGTVQNYLDKRHAERQHAHTDTSGHAIAKRAVQHGDKERKREAAEKRQERYKTLKPLKNKLSKIEADIAELERRKTAVENSLANEKTYKDENLARTLTADYKKLTEHIERLYDDWAKVQGEIEILDGEG